MIKGLVPPNKVLEGRIPFYVDESELQEVTLVEVRLKGAKDFVLIDESADGHLE
jgi:hypothetical protein